TDDSDAHGSERITDYALLVQLNPQQRAAATYTEGPVLIVAGPGTGKTRTLTVRIAHLIRDKGVAPESVLAVTFTNKAAEEMQARLADMLEPEVADKITVRTFHALGALILQEFATEAGLPANFTILDEEGQHRLLRRACPELSGREARAALAAISAVKNELAQAEAPDPDILRRYATALNAAQAVDFDDLLARTAALLEQNEPVRQTLHQRFRWISVDEYQDLNPVQHRLLRLLAAGGANVCAIGDPDQAIYGFRGADHRFFLSFEQDFPGARRFQLTQNYRSAQAILDAASQVIARNPERQALELFSDFVEQVKLTVYRAPTDKAEAEYVVHQIEQMVGGTSYFSLDSGRVEDDTQPVDWSFNDFAVLYRLNAQARLLEEAFDRSGIPYQTVGGLPLTRQSPAREVLAHLWLLRNPGSPVHWEQVLADGVGHFEAEQMDALVAHLQKDGRDTAMALEGAAQELPGLNRRQRERLVALAGFYRNLGRPARTVDDLVAETATFLQEFQGKAFSAGEEERLARLRRRAAPFRHRLDDFLAAMALQSETDLYDPRADRVTLMSL
ncbi:MAG: hypothetical protein D6790_02235, partial [Caldilineae bacterium]